MPEQSPPKLYRPLVPDPWESEPGALATDPVADAPGSEAKPQVAARLRGSVALPAYAELHCKTNFSFLEGASHPDELVHQAAALGYHALAITDRNSVAGMVRAHVAARQVGLKLLIGAEITPRDAPPAVLLATDRAAYGRLSRLITVGRRRAPKGECQLSFTDVAEHAEGLIACVLLTPRWASIGRATLPRSREARGGCDLCSGSAYPEGAHSPSHVLGKGVRPLFGAALLRYREAFPGRCYGLAELHHGPHDRLLFHHCQEIAADAGIPLAAANDVHYHVSRRRLLQDALTAVRHGCTVAELGRRRFSNGERYLKSPQQMAELFAASPETVARTVEIADRCTFSLDELRYDYPEELAPSGKTRLEYLRELTEAGARERYPQGVPDRVRRILEHELHLIAKLRYESYFLTVWDLVRYARSRGILCQGRGSAANSAVCFCLGVTSVDPDQIDVLFERFISEERDEAPDIDVDFEHDDREIVIQYVYDKYGRDRAGMTATVITYRWKSAVRDMGKALGLSLDRLDALAKAIGHLHEQDQLAGRLRDAGLDPTARTSRQLLFLVRELLGFPRHLSQHVGGMVITHSPLCEIAPIENAAMADRTIIPWDKDDLDALGILKVDCLALGMLTALHRSFDMLREHYGRTLTLADVPQEDPAVYEMISRADTVGVFQIESRAQMASLPLLRPRTWYDLVIQIAIIRPGPIQGDMVHPYRRRRNGEEPVEYPDERIRQVLHKTLGVPLFQEQAMRLAIVAAGFTPGEADQLRRAMAAWRRTGTIDQFRTKLIAGMRANGYDEEFGERLFHMIRGFGQYGFPESHAASFARLAYASAWLKHHYPEVFTAALLNSQPMGFYAPAQLVRDARDHGVEVRPVDVNHSHWDCTLLPRGRLCRKSGWSPRFSVSSSLGAPMQPEGWTPTGLLALQLGFRLVKGLSASHAEIVNEGRQTGPFTSFEDFARRTRFRKAVLDKLAEADAFRSLSLTRREAVWLALPEREPQPLFDDAEPSEPPALLPAMSPFEEVASDYQTLGLSLRQHPLTFLRDRLRERGVTEASALPTYPADRWVTVGGLIILRQRPATAKGVTFVTLEDETGLVNLIIRQEVWERYHPIAGRATVMLASGPLQRQNEVIHVLVHRLEDASGWLRTLAVTSRDFH
jgi:error-prone DNA polymerase